MARHAKLTDAQVAVLHWVADGRPETQYQEGFEHRITARALERRGLLTIRGHGASWVATITEDGGYYVDHGDYPPSDDRQPQGAPRSAAPPTKRALPPITDLIAQIEAADGVLRFEAPTDEDRVRYRRAAESARAAGEVAPHQRLRLSGVKAGALTISLEEVPATGDQPDRLTVPAEADPRRPEIAALRRTPALLEVSDETRPRALAIVQGIADECTRRGWQLVVDDTPSFAIVVGEDEYRCVLREELEKRDVYPDEEVAAKKYNWQRVSPVQREMHNGRLRIELGPRWDCRSWADRSRWTLDSRLPLLFALIDEKARAAQDKRDRLAQAHETQLAEWNAAIPRARAAYLAALNGGRAAQQVASWQRAEGLRSYASALEARAAAQGEVARAWVAWLRAEADRHDPLLRTEDLRVEESTEVSSSELDKFMPHRWTVRQPPAPPTWLPS